jgi:GNAT superfamily N-acetyltransferase
MLTTHSIRIKGLDDSTHVEQYLTSLKALLLHCVNDDPSASSIGFLAPLSPQGALQHWLEVFPSITGPNATARCLVAISSANEVVATVLVAKMAKETHSFRGEVRKLLVHPGHRRGGLGRRMMEAVEKVAREEMGLEVLTLDTATRTPAREFYKRLGWKEWGICPDYARGADGTKGDCSFFVKMLKVKE